MTDAPDTSWSRPSPRLWRMRQAELGLIALLVIALSMVLAATSPAAAIIVGAAALAVVASSTYFVRRRFRAWGYLEREEDLLVRRGVLVRRLSVVPYGRMQLVEVTAGVMERAFGLSTVKLHTAAAHSDARIPGLEPDESARLRDRLAALGEAKAAGL
jgi:membrane protein YdbS with pleckstrin-like domain